MAKNTKKVQKRAKKAKKCLKTLIYQGFRLKFSQKR
nr:MAG TPA: hypothetical protein [Caudoviricetes sp.]